MCSLECWKLSSISFIKNPGLVPVYRPTLECTEEPGSGSGFINTNPQNKVNSALPRFGTLPEVSILVPKLEHLNGWTLSVGVLQTEKVLNYTSGKSNTTHLHLLNPSPPPQKMKH
jgi:hypothetical protein